MLAARSALTGQTGNWEISLGFNDEGGKQFADITGRMADDLQYTVPFRRGVSAQDVGVDTSTRLVHYAVVHIKGWSNKNGISYAGLPSAREHHAFHGKHLSDPEKLDHLAKRA